MCSAGMSLVYRAPFSSPADGGRGQADNGLE